jgi:hypothetical protein
MGYALGVFSIFLVPLCVVLVRVELVLLLRVRGRVCLRMPAGVGLRMLGVLGMLKLLRMRGLRGLLGMLGMSRILRLLRLLLVRLLRGVLRALRRFSLGRNRNLLKLLVRLRLEMRLSLLRRRDLGVGHLSRLLLGMRVADLLRLWHRLLRINCLLRVHWLLRLWVVGWLRLLNVLGVPSLMANLRRVVRLLRLRVL